MSGNTWQTYDWQQHSSNHYMGKQLFYAPLLVSQSRIGLIRTYTSDRWQLPIGSSLRDNEKKEDSVMRAFYRMFDERKLKAHITDSSNIDDNMFTCDISEINYSADALVYSSYEWTESELNEHIAQCIRIGERPRWNVPGLAGICTDYHVINVGNDTESLSGMIIGYVKELGFFTEEEMNDMHSAETIDTACWLEMNDYFMIRNPYVNVRSSNTCVDDHKTVEWSNSSMDAFHMACAFLALEVALALYVCTLVYG